MADKKNQVTTQQKVLIGIIVFVGLIMFYSKVYSPMQGKINEAKEELSKKQDKLSEMRRTAQQLDKLEKDLEILGQQLKITEKKLPTNNELPQLIKTITDTAKKYGIDIANMKVQSPKSDKFYTSHTYSFSISADYHTLGSFLTEIVG